jgi:predicted nucleic acid-binding protein
MTARRPADRRSVFVDASAFYAAVNSKDTHHQTALVILERLANPATRLFTTTLILAEAHALILRRMNRRVALQFLDDVEDSTAEIVSITAQDERRARDILHQYDDKDFSLTDAISFAVMERLGLNAAFSFDRNFAQYGVTILEG